MTTVMSLIYAPSTVAMLISVLVGLALLIQPRSEAPEPPAELVAAISSWPPPVALQFPPPVYANWDPPLRWTRIVEAELWMQ